jgi:hypothetical protein
MLGLIVIHDETRVNNPGNPAEQGEEKAQNKTQNAAGHQDRDRRQSYTEKITERFQIGYAP